MTKITPATMTATECRIGQVEGPFARKSTYQDGSPIPADRLALTPKKYWVVRTLDANGIIHDHRIGSEKAARDLWASLPEMAAK